MELVRATTVDSTEEHRHWVRGRRVRLMLERGAQKFLHGGAVNEGVLSLYGVKGTTDVLNAAFGHGAPAEAAAGAQRCLREAWRLIVAPVVALISAVAVALAYVLLL